MCLWCPSADVLAEEAFSCLGDLGFQPSKWRKSIRQRYDTLLMKALVTGASGFIGRNLVERLANDGNDVLGIDVGSSPGVQERVIRVDLSDLMKGVEVVFHEAAITSPPQFEQEPLTGLNINISGTYNVLATAVKAGVRKAVIASSSSIYGSINVPAREEMRTATFENLYPMTKVFDEYFAG